MRPVRTIYGGFFYYMLSIMVLVGAYYYVWIAKARQYQVEQSKLIYALMSQTALVIDAEIVKRYQQVAMTDTKSIKTQYVNILSHLQKSSPLQGSTFNIHLSQNHSLKPQATINLSHQGLDNQFDDLSQIAFFKQKHAKQSHDTYVIDGEQLTGYIPLSFGYGIMVQVKHRPIDYRPQALGFWLPIMLALPLLLLGLYVSCHRNRQWQMVIDDAHAIASPQSPLSYQRLSMPNKHLGDAFDGLSTAFSRLFLQTQRQRRALLVNKRLTQRLMEHAPIPMALVCRSGHIGYVNAQFRNVFHLEIIDDAKRYVSDFIMGADKSAQRFINHLTDVPLSKQMMVVGCFDKRHYLLNMNPWFSEHGQMQGIMVSFTDVHELVIKTADDTQVIEQLSARLSSFDKLWSMMGHELRTPLSGILGMLELFGKDSLNNEQKEVFATVERTAESMLGMLNDMLDMAKMDAGKLQINYEITDILTLCRQVCELMVGNARKQGIELLCYFDTSFPRYISTDSVRLRQVLMNLLGNAIKFTKTGYVALIISYDELPTDEQHTAGKQHTADKQEDGNQPWLRFSVQDTGIGISQEEQRHLFTFFNQANNSISSQFGGTGLGLAISKSFVQMMHGTLKLTSIVGQGSDFSVYLPYQRHNQPVYQFSTDFTGIGLYVISSQAISGKYLTQIFNDMALPAFVRVGINDKTLSDITNKQQQVDGTLKSVLLIEHEALNDTSLTLLSQLPDYQNMAKILLSMQPERMVGLNLLDEFDGFLNKPLDISDLVSELMRLTRPNQYFDSVDTRLSAVQTQFNAFMERHAQSNLIQSDLIQSNLAQEQENQSQDHQSTHAIIANIRPNVLLAEDNPINQTVAKKVLNKLGYDVIVANNGQEALELLAKHRQKIALVLMDCRMPIKDGLTASQEIRQKRDSIPIIALTANASDEDRQLCLKAGMNDFLTKPVRVQNLEPLLNKYDLQSKISKH